MTQLSDTQTVLLSNAAQRVSGSLLPLPASLKPGGGATKALAALLNRALIEERETDDPAAVRRAEGERRLGLFLTEAGAKAIGIALPGEEQPEVTGDDTPASTTLPPRTGKTLSKTELVLDLMRRSSGATLPELIAVTGWLPQPIFSAIDTTVAHLDG